MEEINTCFLGTNRSQVTYIKHNQNNFFISGNKTYGERERQADKKQSHIVRYCITSNKNPNIICSMLLSRYIIIRHQVYSDHQCAASTGISIRPLQVKFLPLLRLCIFSAVCSSEFPTKIQTHISPLSPRVLHIKRVLFSLNESSTQNLTKKANCHFPYFVISTICLLPSPLTSTHFISIIFSKSS